MHSSIITLCDPNTIRMSLAQHKPTQPPLPQNKHPPTHTHLCVGYEAGCTGNVLCQVVPIVPEPSVRVIRSRPGSVLVSIAMPGCADEPDACRKQRVMVGSEHGFFSCTSCQRAGRFSCAHVKALGAWCEQLSEAAPLQNNIELTEGAFDGLRVKAAGEAVRPPRAVEEAGAQPADHASVSTSKIPLDFRSSAADARSTCHGRSCPRSWSCTYACVCAHVNPMMQ
jgi:hypothetical protein